MDESYGQRSHLWLLSTKCFFWQLTVRGTGVNGVPALEVVVVALELENSSSLCILNMVETPAQQMRQNHVIHNHALVSHMHVLP